MLHLQQNYFPHNRILWSEVLAETSCSNQRVDDIEVVTLKSHYIELIYEAALNQVLKKGTYSEDKFQRTVHQVVMQNDITVQESVTVSYDRIIAIIDREIVDQPAIYAALDLVADALDVLDGRKGRVAYGEQRTFLTTETPLLYRH